MCYSNSYEQLEAKVQELLVEGYSVSQTLLQLHDKLITMNTITDQQKSVIAERMGVSHLTLQSSACLLFRGCNIIIRGLSGT